MPTGLTQGIVDGTMSLRDFAYACARNSGNLMRMRDEPKYAPIPGVFEVQEYISKQLYEATDEWKSFDQASHQQLKDMYQAECDEKDRINKNFFDSRVSTYNKYIDMKNRILAYTNWPEHLQELMLRQIKESIEFDCGPASEMKAEYKGVKHPSFSDWSFNKEQSLIRKVEDAAESLREEVEYVNKLNDWVKHLNLTLKELENESQ